MSAPVSVFLGLGPRGDITEQILKERIEEVCQLVSLRMRERFAFADCASMADAEALVQKLNGVRINSSTLTVQISKRDDPRRNDRDRRDDRRDDRYRRDDRDRRDDRRDDRRVDRHGRRDRSRSRRRDDSRDRRRRDDSRDRRRRDDSRDKRHRHEDRDGRRDRRRDDRERRDDRTHEAVPTPNIDTEYVSQASPINDVMASYQVPENNSPVSSHNAEN